MSASGRQETGFGGGGRQWGKRAVGKTACLLVIFAAGCVQPPATFRGVDYPATPAAEWVKSGPPWAAVDRSCPAEGDLRSFREDLWNVSALRVAASPEDFYGSKLFDGFDLTVQPLDDSNRVVKKLGHLTATLYRFEGDTYSGEGEPLMTWSVPASRMLRLWAEKGIDRGYRMKLAWHVRPMVKDVKLDVRFETLDGKTFSKIISAGSVDQPRYRWLDK